MFCSANWNKGTCGRLLNEADVLPIPAVWGYKIFCFHSTNFMVLFTVLLYQCLLLLKTMKREY